MDLKITCGSWYQPKPREDCPYGEDSHFYCADRKIFGVADGVGGYRRYGIDSGIYARELMSNAEGAIAELFSKHNNIKNIPLEVMKKAFDNTTVQGASTACIISLKGQDIHAANVGDSGFVVVRSGKVIYHSPEQCFAFNCPVQLGCDAHDPKAAQTLCFKNVQEGDVIVAGTDGLFDNLFDEEIALAVRQAKENEKGPQLIAELVGEMALKASKDSSCETPFVAKMLNAGSNDHHVGGKVDDITVVVADVYTSSAMEQTSVAGVFLSGRSKGTWKKKMGVGTWRHIVRSTLAQTKLLGLKAKILSRRRAHAGEKIQAFSHENLLKRCFMR